MFLRVRCVLQLAISSQTNLLALRLLEQGKQVKDYEVMLDIAKTSKTSFIETSGSASYTLSGNTWYVEGGYGSKPSADSTGVSKNPNIAGLDNMLKEIF